VKRSVAKTRIKRRRKLTIRGQFVPHHTLQKSKYNQLNSESVTEEHRLEILQRSLGRIVQLVDEAADDITEEREE
jgi:hypothetical protein